MFSNVKKWLAFMYLQYELSTCIYMFEPWEKTMINTVVVFMAMLLTFSSYMYLPTYTSTLLTLLSPAHKIGDVYIPQPPPMPIS